MKRLLRKFLPRKRTETKIVHQESIGGLSLTVTATTELSSEAQIAYLKLIGHEGESLSKQNASFLITRTLRPIGYAISKTFKNASSLEKDQIRALESALAHWEYLPNLPRYGPYSTWEDLEASGHDHHRSLTKEERHQITDIALEVLNAETFLSLVSNGVKKYKDQLDASLTTEA